MTSYLFVKRWLAAALTVGVIGAALFVMTRTSEVPGPPYVPPEDLRPALHPGSGPWFNMWNMGGNARVVPGKSYFDLGVYTALYAAEIRSADRLVGRFLAGLGSDVRHAVRAMRRRPFTAVAAMATVALGVGLNAAVLSIFDCDRAWLVYPCDPDALTWRASMEHTRPEFPGAFALGVELPVDEE